MKEVVVKVVYAFSISGTGGNPAGVVLDADSLSAHQKQVVAATAGLSEIAFVSKSNQANFKLDFFTPTRQIAHCGHATIATFSYLKKNGFIAGDRSSKETIDGNRDIYFKNGLVYMEQAAPTYQYMEIDLPEILHSLNLTKAALLENYAPSIVNTGNSFLIIPVANEVRLQKIRPDMEKINHFSEKHHLIGYYIFSLMHEEPVTASARMFAPRYGIEEEAATGMAAGPLACYLFENRFTQKTELTIKQGEYMTAPSPSLIHVNLLVDNKTIKKLYAGGDAFVAEEMLLKI